MIPTEKEWHKALCARHGRDLQEKFSASTVAVCGLGGLGSNIATALARAGVGRLLLIDYDRVDISNLHRQQYRACQIGMLKTDAMRENILEIAPYVKTEIFNEKVTPESVPRLLGDADVICEAFDGAEAKAMLAESVAEHFPKKFYVCASGMAGLLKPNSVKTRRLGKNFYICGDGVSDISLGMGLMSAGVMLCAAHQAQTVLRILAGEYEV